MSNLNNTKLQTASGRDDAYVYELDGIWNFGGRLMTANDALNADYTQWEEVMLPHTWNSVDAEDGGNDYDRATYWYHKVFNIKTELAGNRIYIEFLGSNTKTDVYVNGKKAGDTHKGGYTTFRYDITDYVVEGENRLDVMVDNTVDQSIVPISGDFNMYGGIYRRVYLVMVDEVHIELDNNGSSGLFLMTGNMRSKERPVDLGEFKVKTNIVNDADCEKTIEVIVSVIGDNAPNDISSVVNIVAKESISYEADIKIENPTLWEGIRHEKDADNSKFGYMYTVTVELRCDGKTIDRVEEKLGFRYFWIDDLNDMKERKGFYLNGRSYPLRGVNRHSYLAGVGSAMTEEQHKYDMDIMLEMGINTVRLCHYPQTDYFYDLCDEKGIIVWTEIPMVNMIGSAPDFEEVTISQLTELILQQYNRPSVVFWGIANEIGNGTDLFNALAHPEVSKAKRLLYKLDGTVKKLDTTGRYTTQAVNRDYAMNQNDEESVNKDFENNTGWKSDLVSWNIYPGWYPDENFYGTFEEVMMRKSALDNRAMGISEYGWGSNTSQHEAYPYLGEDDVTSGGNWHPEEYQNMMNEEAISYINRNSWLWSTYCWVMFDFAVDARNEGGLVALNDKGLVTGDRKTKKDSYYLYKANWNKRDGFVYITSRRWRKREQGDGYVKVYSNCDKVELFINGESCGIMKNIGNGVFCANNIFYKEGEMNIKVIGAYVDEECKCVDDVVIEVVKSALS